jgi:hypothetical protein
MPVASLSSANTLQAWRLRVNDIISTKLDLNTPNTAGPWTHSGLLSVSGRLAVTTNLNVSGNTTIGAAGKVANVTGWFGVAGRQTISTNLFVGANTTVVGNMGVGPAAPEAQFTISHATAPTLYISETSTTGTPVLFLKQYGSTGEGLKITYDSATGHSYINNVYNLGYLYFQTAGANRALFDYSGNFLPASTNTYDLGSTGNRWRNIYTQDLHLSNGIGDYTVVEGEEDLFLVNNKTGKSFKFALIEVDPSQVPPKSET